MSQLQIRVYTASLDLEGIVEDYESASFTRSYFEAGEWSITINRNIPNATLLQKGRYVQFGDDTRDAGKITRVKTRIDENGKGSQYLIVSGIDLRAMFAQRTVMQLNDIDTFYLTAPGETVIKTLVSTQCGSTCTDVNRRFTNLTIATDQGRGLDYTISTKYTSLYGECARAAIQGAIGWYVYIDHTTKTFILDCEVGIDRTTGAGRCLFSPDMDSLKSATFSDDLSTLRNLVYVGGDGQGRNRIIHTGFDTTEPTGFNRYEMFSDASNLSTASDLIVEADAVLEQYNQTFELDGEVLVVSPYEYKTDYNVGDICTVKFNDTENDVRILDVTQEWSFAQYSIAVTWGKPITTIAGQIASLSKITAGKSSTSETGTNVSGMKSGVISYSLSSANRAMTGAECIYNVIELTGTISVDRTFTLYLDTTRYYGKKSYRIIVAVKASAGKRKITLTTGLGDDLEIYVRDTQGQDTHDIFVNESGDVIGSFPEWQLPLKATNFPGICAECPILAADISINYTTRVLTITPPLGSFHFFVDGGGVVTSFEKTGPVAFPAFTDTTGIWYFYFDSTGTAVTSLTPWTSFDTIAPVYRLLWNATKTGPDKSVVHALETHLNTISGVDHAWKHKQGAIWFSGADCFNNKLASGTPNADGRNAVIAINTGVMLDDNLEYTVTNSTGGGIFQQDLGNITPASLNATNSALFAIRYETGASLVDTLPATRFPFAWEVASNRPQFITSTGTRTLVDNLNFFVYFIYVIQDPRTGQSIRSVSAPVQFTSITDALASTWATIQSTFTTLNDNEIRPLYRLAFEYKQTWDAGTKYSVLRDVTDLRKEQVAQLSLSAGSLPASSVSFIPGTSGLVSTNVQTALVELARPTTAKTAIVDADEVQGNDSAATFSPIRTTWTAIKAFLFPTANSDMDIAFGGSSTGITYAYRTATWQMRGDRCTINGFIVLTNKGSATGSATINGLPFTVKNTVPNYTPVLLRLSNISFANQFMGYAAPNGTSINLEECTEAGINSSLTNADFTNDSTIMFSLTYTVA